MQSKKNPVPVWKQEPPPSLGLNLLKPFSKEDFPAIAKTQQDSRKPSFYGT